MVPMMIEAAAMPPVTEGGAPAASRNPQAGKPASGRSAPCGSGVGLQQSSEFAPEQSVVRHNAKCVFARHRLMPEIAARAFENQSARRDVPQPNPRLEVGVHPPARHV